jgi:DNA (cytosine-5)-methyltransferase 1
MTLAHRSSPTFIDLFSGAGGLSLGLQQAGWVGLGAVDSWKEAISSYSANISGHPVMNADIADPATAQRVVTEFPCPDWLVGGPPCQGFSSIGKRDRSDPRNQLIGAFARTLEALNPEGFLVENVVGLRDMNFVDPVKALFTRFGYLVTSHIVTAASFGVPQLRRRIIFVGHKSIAFTEPPIPTHKPTEYVTVDDAIGDLPPLAAGATATAYVRPPYTDYQRSMRRHSIRLQGHQASRHPPHLIEAISWIPDGGNRRSIPPKLQFSSGFHNSYARLHSQSPAVAITQNMGKPSSTRCIHPYQNRGLTAREGARLQSFPDTFQFSGGVTSQRRQIANAVPPLLGRALGCYLHAR